MKLNIFLFNATSGYSDFEKNKKYYRRSVNLLNICWIRITKEASYKMSYKTSVDRAAELPIYYHIFSLKYIQRHFSHLRFIFLLIIVLNTLEAIHHITKPQIVFRKHFKNDLKYCEKCFQSQILNCSNFFELIQSDEEFIFLQLLNLIPSKLLPRKRQTQLIKFKNSKEKVIAKYFSYKKLAVLKNNFKKEEIKKELILNIENLQGMQYAPLKTLDKFIKHLHESHANNLTETTIWLYMLINSQTILLPVFEQRNFPVPQLYAKCGFTIFQEYAGEDLHKFFKRDFNIKVQIAQQLLEAALKFSYGFDNYRIYITDLTADNIVYDTKRNRLTFIDLDTIFIVDSTQARYKSMVHRHQYIECPGCFAYSAENIASYNISDVNIYSVCQFLREDLYKDLTRGFLYPLPQQIKESHPSLHYLINKCVDCPNNSCQERLTIAEEIMKIFQQINEAFVGEVNRSNLVANKTS